MGLTSPVLLGCVAGLAVLLPIVLVITWRRRPAGVGGALLRWVGIVVSQALLVSAVGLYANNTFGFYNTWSDLLGGASQAATIETNGLVAANGSQGRVEKLTVKIPGGQGPESERLGVMVWLPKEYDDAANSNKDFPTVMMLPGQPSDPGAVFNGFDFGVQASTVIASGKVPPFVAVLPPIMIAPPRDTECTDVPNGPQAYSWLLDVRSQVVNKYRVHSGPVRWSAMGFSTGGFCAAKLLTKDRDKFGAAVSIAGYFEPTADNTTGDLFGGSMELQNQNSPLYLMQQSPQQQTNLLIVVSQDDTQSWAPGESYADSEKTINATKSIPGVSTLVLQSGGHSFDTYAPTLPQSLEWLAKVGAIS
jgi:dienelactone hydrolase